MDFEQQLAEAQARIKELVNKINALEEEKQSLLREILRYEGETRALQRLQAEQTKGTK